MQNIQSHIEVSKTEVHALLERIMALIAQDKAKNDSLSMGRTALAFLHLYYGKYLESEIHSELAYAYLQRVFDNLGSEDSSFQTCEYYKGLTGLLVAIDHLSRKDLIEFEMEDLKAVENLTIEWAIDELQKSNIDFFNGANGVIHYLIQRLKGSHSKETKKNIESTLCTFVDVIQKILVTDLSGNIVMINSYYIKADQKKESYVNFGLTHGLTGILINLIHIKNNGILKSKCQILIDKLINSILQLREIHRPPYPLYFVNQLDLKTQQIKYQYRLGWCYSDLNITHAFALENVSTPKYTSIICESIEAITNRKTYDLNLLEDPFLCHGFAGLGQYYLKLYQLTQNPLCLKAYHSFMGSTLDFYQEKPDSYFFSPEFLKTKHNHSLFYGNTGVALSLISYLKPTAANWSEIIML